MSGTRRTTPGRRVHVYDPSGSVYYRLSYKDELGRRRTRSGGRTLAAAMKKALDIERRLGLSEPAAQRATTVGDLFDAFEDPARPKFDRPPGPQNTWTPGYTDLVASRMRTLRPALGHIRLPELCAMHIDVVVNSASTYNQAHALRGTLSSVVSFGVRKGFLHAEQQYVAKVDIKVDRGPRPPRRKSTPEEGESALLIDDHEVPTDLEVAAMAQAAVGYSHWEGLVQLLAYAGPRIHEAIALTADDVLSSPPGVCTPAVLRIRRQLVEPRGGGVRLTPPKNGRARSVSVVERTASDFPLAEWLLERAAQARREQADGSNSLALLFPTKRKGSYWRLRNLRTRLFVPAAQAAGWSYETFVAPAPVRLNGEWVNAPRPYTQWDHPIHALRHRFATTARDEWGYDGRELCLAGGWASEDFVVRRYYGVTPGVLASAAEKQQAAVDRRRLIT